MQSTKRIKKMYFLHRPRVTTKYAVCVLSCRVMNPWRRSCSDLTQSQARWSSRMNDDKKRTCQPTKWYLLLEEETCMALLIEGYVIKTRRRIASIQLRVSLSPIRGIYILIIAYLFLHKDVSKFLIEGYPLTKKRRITSSNQSVSISL